MKFFIITINLNNANGLEKTILSILIQNYKELKHIIIDGGSQDNSNVIIEKYSSSYNLSSVSESDKGIYDAMNKGIDQVVSKEGFTLFLNSGDTFKDSSLLSKLNSYLIQKCITSEAFIYGDHIYKRKKQKKHIRGKNIKNILKGMPFSHQSIFIPNHFLKESKYSLLYNIAGDYDYFLRAWKKNYNFIRVPFIISEVTGGGISDKKRILGVKERIRSLEYNNLMTNKLKLWYWIRLLRVYLIEFIKTILRL